MKWEWNNSAKRSPEIIKTFSGLFVKGLTIFLLS